MFCFSSLGYQSALTSIHFLLLHSGGMQDWNYLHTNCFELTIEMGCTKFPNADRLPSYWQANKFSLLVFMGQVCGSNSRKEREVGQMFYQWFMG